MKYLWVAPQESDDDSDEADLAAWALGDPSLAKAIKE